MSDNLKLLDLAKICASKYKICVNAISAEKTQYRLNNYDMFVIDDKLSISQRLIGEVTNTAQHLMSEYWHRLSKNEDAEDILDKINVLTVLSGVSIDLAKKLYDVDFEKELINNSVTGEKPLFFRYVQAKKHKNKGKNKDKNKKKKKLIKNIKYNCPMDYLQEIIQTKNAKQTLDINILDLLIKRSLKNANRKQQKKIIDLTNEMCNKLNGLYVLRVTGDTEEIDRQIKDVITEYSQVIKNRKMKSDTMYGLILAIINNGDFALRQLNALYKAYPEVFISAFKKKSSQIKDNIA